ncbi:unnamed protein product [Ambrosiozyma monospora]|uniref:Unnamed protein product n=1 Tax=Ambrosiozyma monospora TaxID=43982 RepID=A0ACB5T3E9_AMBMO|nr:unnamed protein product [Ambrosiozyma monospora]
MKPITASSTCSNRYSLSSSTQTMKVELPVVYYPDDTFSSKLLTEPVENQQEVYSITRDLPTEVKLTIMKYVLALNFNLLNDLLTIIELIKLNDVHVNESLKLAFSCWCVDKDVRYMPLFMEYGAFIKYFASIHNVQIHMVEGKVARPDRNNDFAASSEQFHFFGTGDIPVKLLR